MNVAILGYGVVGSGTYEILNNNGYKVSKVLDIRQHQELGSVHTTNYDEILSDPEIGVVVEAIGGLEPAHTFLVKAIKAGKHVVSSNKHLICTYYDEFLNLARENGVTVKFSASAGGGIPWLHNLRRATRCDNITKVCGIMNGTTNFILDAMISDSSDFEETLATAQSLGYAEADPSADIDGLDTARKTAISSSIAFNCDVTEDGVDIFGIRNIKKCDIEYIKMMGKTIRYVGTGIMTGDAVSAFVEPLIINTDSVLSCVKKNNNMISLVGDNVGQLSFFGQGAGKYPTGISVAQDVIDIINGDTYVLNPGAKVEIDNSLVEKKYYIRTRSDIDFDDVAERVSNDGQYNYIITKTIKVSEMHILSDKILSKDGESFFAGIEG